MNDDCECGVDALEDNSGLSGDMDRDLGERSGLPVTSDFGLGDDEGVVASFERVFRVREFLDLCRDVLRKSELSRGRL